MSETLEIKDGDIFRWHYLTADSRWGDPYWCKSRIAVVKNGCLRDTYWMIGTGDGAFSTSDGATWSLDEARLTLDLEYVGNFADLEKMSEGNARYYADADCVNLNHSNSSRDNFYIRKGAEKCRAKMRAVAAEERESAVQKMVSAAYTVSRLDRILSQIDQDVPLGEIYL